jgi:hypothetical protein
MALARGGQTLISGAARDALGDALPAGTALESHGFYRLKGIEQPVEVFELGVTGVAPFAPPTDVEKGLPRRSPTADLWCPVREVRHNLPAERDAFRRPDRGAARARHATRRRCAPPHRARLWRHREDPPCPPLWLELAWRLAGWHLFLRSLGRAFARRHRFRSRCRRSTYRSAGRPW